MDLEAAITAKVKADISALGGRIFPLTADQNTQLPYATYQRISTTRNPTLTEQGAFDTAIQFDIYASAYGQVKSLIKSIRECFEDHVGQYATGAPYVQRTTIINEFDGYNSDTKEYEGILEISFFT